MAAYREDIIEIELQSGTVTRSFLNKAIGEGDNSANRYGVTLVRDGEPVSLDGVTCSGYFIRPNGDTVVIPGTVSGLNAYVTLPQACYVYEGAFTLAIKLEGTNFAGTMRIIDGMVVNTTTDTLVDPGHVIPDIDELLAIIEEAQIAIGNTVRYDIVQTRTASEKERARTNINALDKDLFDALGLYVSSGYVCQRLQNET